MILLSALALGCLQVPREAPVLARRMGNDLTALHAAHRALVRAFFANLRQQRVDYLDQTWTPRFLGHWVQDGRLADIARGTAVWSEAQRAFVTPPAGRRDGELVASAQAWSMGAIQAIERKRAALLAPLDEQEARLLGSVDEAFDRLGQANAALTAQLASLTREGPTPLEPAEAKALDELLRKIAQEIGRLSEDAGKSMKEVARADGLPLEAGPPTPGEQP